MSGVLVVLALCAALALALAQWVVLRHYRFVSKRVETAAIGVETVTRTIQERQVIQGEERVAHEEGADRAVIEVKEQLGDIHTLVNSDMTEARTEAMNRTRELAECRRLALGANPTEAEARELAMLDGRVVELESLLADRAQAQERIDAKQRS